MMRGPLGVPVVVGSVATRGLFDAQGVMEQDDVGIRPRAERVLTLNATETPLALQAAVTIDGVAHVVQTPPLPIEDGGLVRYGVTLASPEAWQV